LKQTPFCKSGKEAYVIGEVGFCDELVFIGVSYIGGLLGGLLEIDPDMGAVIVGFD
jgi:hypothetical protein